MAFFPGLSKSELQGVLESHAAGVVVVLFLPLCLKVRLSEQLQGLSLAAFPRKGTYLLLPAGAGLAACWGVSLVCWVVVPSRSGWGPRCSPASSLALSV